MKTSPFLTALVVCWVSSTAAAQQSTPVADAMRSAAARAGRNLVAAAEVMPAAKYGFKPTPAQMSFGDVIEHLAQGNDYLCGTIGGTKPPKRDEVKPAAGKAKLVDRLKETFGFCESALAKVDDSNLSGKVPFFGEREITRAEAMFATVDDWADHYSQLANYLRLNGHLPPTAKKKAE
jgi:uncharacterized damage-inducible protein DinB